MRRYMKYNRNVYVLVLSMAVMLAGCGNNASQAAKVNDAIDSAEAVSSEDNQSAGADIQENEAAVIEETAYFEENGLVFKTDLSYELPFAAGTYDPDELEYKEYTGVAVEPVGQATLTIGDIATAKCDKAGYKAYTIDYSIEGTVRTTVDTYDYDEDYFYEPQMPHIDLADYYSGRLLPYYATNERDEEGYDYIEKVSFNNKITEIAYYNLISGYDSEEGEWELDESADTSQYEYYDTEVIEYHTIEVRIPENYDGLVLAIDLNGITEYDTSEYHEYQNTERRLLLDADSTGYAYNADTSAFIRFSDIAGTAE